MKMVAFELEEWERAAFLRLKQEHEVALTARPLKKRVPAKYADADIISIFIYSNLGADTLRQFGNLKMVATRSTGFEHIDRDYCRERGITVCNVPAYADETVAEHVFALLLGISHNIPRAVQRTSAGDFSPAGLEGFDLRGKTLGVVGAGKIGFNVIEIARGFRMEVLAFDLHPDEAAASRLGFRYVAMDELLAKSDVVSLHVPGGKSTYHLISAKELKKMKPGAVLINTSRGDVVDLQALLEALARKKLAAAGLDVLPEEPTIREEAELLRSIFTRRREVNTLFASHMLAHLPQVLITPHTAFNTREAKQRLLDATIENIRAFIRAEPQNVVT